MAFADDCIYRCVCVCVCVCVYIYMYICERLIMALADACQAGEDDRSSMHPQASLSLSLSLSMHPQASPCTFYSKKTKEHQSQGP